MITLQLELANEQQLVDLAKRRGLDTSEVAAHIIEAYLDSQAWGHDTAEQWSEASVALAGEVFAEENWTEGDSADGPG